MASIPSLNDLPNVNRSTYFSRLTGFFKNVFNVVKTNVFNSRKSIDNSRPKLIAMSFSTDTKKTSSSRERRVPKPIESIRELSLVPENAVRKLQNEIINKRKVYNQRPVRTRETTDLADMLKTDRFSEEEFNICEYLSGGMSTFLR